MRFPSQRIRTVLTVEPDLLWNPTLDKTRNIFHIVVGTEDGRSTIIVGRYRVGWEYGQHYWFLTESATPYRVPPFLVGVQLLPTSHPRRQCGLSLESHPLVHTRSDMRRYRRTVLRSSMDDVSWESWMNGVESTRSGDLHLTLNHTLVPIPTGISMLC